MGKVTIKNTTVGTVSIIIPEMRLNRTIKQNGSISLPKEVLEEALDYPGVRELFEEQDLAIIDEEFRIESGLQDEDEKVDEEAMLNFDEIKKTISTGTPYQMKKLLEEATPARYQAIAQAAYECEDISMAKIEQITKATGIDIMQGIKGKQLM